MRLPPELLAVVISHIPARQKGTLAALMSVSSACYALAGKKLYAELRVSSSNLAGVLRGLDRGACECAAITPPPSPSTASCPFSSATVATTTTTPATPAGSRSETPTSACGCPCSPADSEGCERPKKRAYPNPASDERKRALLAFTRYLTVESVPDCRCWSPPTTVRRAPGTPGGAAAAATAATACPLNKMLLPNVRVVRVLASVPQHAVVAFERRRRA